MKKNSNLRRSTKYLQNQKALRKLMVRARKLALDLATPASFPDSGYHYNNLHTQYLRLDHKIMKQISKPRYDKWNAQLQRDCDKAEREYFEPYFLADDGVLYSQAELDSMMAH